MISRYQKGDDGRYHFVYAVINTINGKYYYGRRSTNILKDNYFGSGKRIKAEIKKYGKEKFIRREMFFFATADDSKKAEQEIIDRCVNNNPQCYNLSKSAAGGYTYYDERNYKHSPFQKEKISRANKGRLRPDARKSVYERKFNKWWKDRKRSTEDKQLKREAALKSVINGNHASKQLLTCPHCYITMGIGNAKRWHFDNCKEK